MKTIKQSVLNTFKRVGIQYNTMDNTIKDHIVYNRFDGGSCKTTELISYLIDWVYNTSNKYERGDYAVKVSDFDRIRYFVLDQDQNAYNVCLD